MLTKSSRNPAICRPDHYWKENLQFLSRDETAVGHCHTHFRRPKLAHPERAHQWFRPSWDSEFREMVKRLNQELGITVIISSHILSSFI